MSELHNIYKRRIDKVINYIHDHLTEPLSLDKLASRAYFSSFHFHRIFMAITGETLNNFITRTRIEKSARLLTFSRSNIREISMMCGFSSPSTFSRSFKHYFGTSPSQYRKNKKIRNSKICNDLYPISQHIVPMSEDQLKKAFPVEIRNFPTRRVAFLRVLGAYQEGVVLQAFENLVKWAQEKKIYKSETIFGMSLDDPFVTPQDQYRYEVCITIPKTLPIENEKEVLTMEIPACSYALTRVSGNLDMVATATSYLFNQWLIRSQFEPEHMHAMEIFLDKENICNWNHFELEICIPVKPLINNYNHN